MASSRQKQAIKIMDDGLPAGTMTVKRTTNSLSIISASPESFALALGESGLQL